MKLTEAEKLLGGHATGTLTEAERTALFAAALEHQDLFDALMDEEALRELLADPEARAQLLAALAPAASPKVVPFWRRTGVLGAAASLIVAATAGLAYLRSPEALPPVNQEAAKAPAAKAIALSAEAPAPAAPARKGRPAAPLKETVTPLQVAEVPAPVSVPVPVSAPAPPPQRLTPQASAREDSAQMRTQADFRRAEAQDNLTKKAEATRPGAAAVVEVLGSVAPAPVATKAKASAGAGWVAPVAPLAPTWTLETQPDGRTQVTVTAPRGPQVVLLRRGALGIQVLQPRPPADHGDDAVQWRWQVRLTDGDVLDLYLLKASAADPAHLPEAGPVDGFRARIHPAEKKAPTR